MKRNIFITFLVLLSLKALSQESMVTLSGGYSFANIEKSDVRATGWRINGLYEFMPVGTYVAHGFSFGFITLSATADNTKSTVTSLPVYYAPKLIFGSEKIKGFIKGALGTQFAWIKREGFVTLSDNDFGFYGGGGAGILLFLKDNIFINAEYEIAYASNSFYKDGWISTAGGGIGFKF
jgi:hypothetical protein